MTAETPGDRAAELLESCRGQNGRLIEDNKRLRALALLMQRKALEGLRAWDSDQNIKAGKALKALAGISPGYWPDMDALIKGVAHPCISAEIENQFTISEWATSVFGEAGSDARVAARANEEMAELIRACTSGAPVDKIVEEAADVVIVLYRIFSRNGRQMTEEIDKKMAVNRTREWRKDGTGHGYHVRSKAEES